jgi:hypothetical protein
VDEHGYADWVNCESGKIEEPPTSGYRDGYAEA